MRQHRSRFRSTALMINGAAPPLRATSRAPTNLKPWSVPKVTYLATVCASATIPNSSTPKWREMYAKNKKDAKFETTSPTPSLKTELRTFITPRELISKATFDGRLSVAEDTIYVKALS